MTTLQHSKIIIIGSGPAGLTAAIYTARANLSPILFEGEQQPGGQLTITTEVDNYPGFPVGILGPELMVNMRAQAERFHTRIISRDVTSVNLQKRPFQVTVGKEIFSSDALIVSTGAVAKLLNIPSEQELMGYGVSACATCDGYFFKDQDVAVVGGGDTAIEEAIFLTKFCRKVTLVHRRHQLRASKIMQDRTFANPKISYVWNSVVEDIIGNRKEGVQKVQLRNVETNKISDLNCTGIFIAIGHQPNTTLFKDQLELNSQGYIVTKPGSTYTNIEGVFASGDVQDSTYRQAVTAAGTGCMAAIDAERWLELQHGT